MLVNQQIEKEGIIEHDYEEIGLLLLRGHQEFVGHFEDLPGSVRLLPCQVVTVKRHFISLSLPRARQPRAQNPQGMKVWVTHEMLAGGREV